MAQPRRLVLASTSRYRKELLARLALEFAVAAPHVDERPLGGEAPAQTALRLATLKAQAVRAAHRDALIIGCDQVATSGGRALGKPGDHARAAEQLRALSGKSADFHTALALLDAANGRLQTEVVPCRVHFRELDDARIETEDPTSLIGLPLIALTAMLERAGLPVP